MRHWRTLLASVALLLWARPSPAATPLTSPGSFGRAWVDQCQTALKEPASEADFATALGKWDTECAGDKAACHTWILARAAETFETKAKALLDTAANGTSLAISLDDDPSRLARLSPLLNAEARRVLAQATAAFVKAVGEALGDDAKAKGKAAVAKLLEEEAAKQDGSCVDRQDELADQFSFQRGAELQFLADLQKKTGFSSLVTCTWVRSPDLRDQLACVPELRLSAQTASAIVIRGPQNAPAFGLRRLQARASEVTRPDHETFENPRGCLEDSYDLACDLAVYDPPRHDQVRQEFPTKAPSAALIRVHKNRVGSTSFGCDRFLGRNRGCAVERLRHSLSDDPALVLTGSSPAILIEAEDEQGRVANALVLIGYERWRFETGGFLAATPAVDDVAVIAPGSAAGKVKVTAIRERDSLAQDTGLFLNFIPTNHEWIAWGVGFATASENRWATYLGPSMRLQSFGNRGIAALVAGLVLRPVSRLPDVPLNVDLDATDVRLKPELQTDTDWFVGLQLGFSFGPIGSGESER